MRQTMLRGGIAGCGAVITTAHMPGWRALKDVEIVAVCDPREEAAIQASRHWGIPRTYGNLSQMLSSEKLDFVDICSPPLTHCQLAIQALEAGLHVLVEKPMALRVSEADEMITAAREHSVKLCVLHNFLFSPVVQRAKSFVATGAIGELLSVEIRSLNSREFLREQNHWYYNLPGGIFGEVTPHPVYLLLAFLGNIRSVHAVTRKHSRFPWVAADELKVMVEAENGLGAFTISLNSSRESFTIDIFGTKGNIHVNNFPQTLTRSRPRTGKLHELILDRLDLTVPVLTSAASGAVSQLRGQKRNRIGHKVIIQRFVESIRDNTDPPVSEEDGKETIRILEEIWKQISQPTSSLEG